MPIIRYVPVDPFDLVIQGEQLRQSVFDAPTDNRSAGSVVLGNGENIPSGLKNIVQDEDVYLPMNCFVEIGRLTMRRQRDGVLQMRSGAGIATPTGAWAYNDWSPLLLNFFQASVRFVITGTTLDSNSSPISNCRVIALETGRMALNGSPIVGEATSNGSGIYTINVPTNSSYQCIAYKPGSPDIAGITVNNVVPTAV